MTLRDFIQSCEEVDNASENFMDKEIEFNTLNRDKLELLSIYEDEDKIIFDVGTSEDNDERNTQVA